MTVTVGPSVSVVNVMPERAADTTQHYVYVANAYVLYRIRAHGFPGVRRQAPAEERAGRRSLRLPPAPREPASGHNLWRVEVARRGEELPSAR